MKYFITLLWTINLLQAQNGLIINEFSARNISSYYDENRTYSDWIELFNNSASAIDLAGMYLSDDTSQITKWQIPDGSGMTLVEPYHYIILWADANPAAGPLHLDFKLSASGEQLVLTAADGTTIMDSLTYPEQTADFSYGRSDTNSTVFNFFDEITPDTTNGTGYSGIVSNPVIETPSANYSAPIDVIVTHPDENVALYYTLDGSIPTLQSLPYTGPLNLASSSVFSVRAFKEGLIPSHQISKAYFFNENFNLPVLTIISDPPGLFSDSTGIYVNYSAFSATWERPFSGHYFKEGSAHSFNGGIRIQGRTSRVLPKKAFRLFFKPGYGQDRLQYDLFGLPWVKSFKNIVTRPGYDDDISSANSLGSLLRDPLASEGWKASGGLTSAGNFAIMYINNDYWGIYNLRESINDFFIQDHLGYTDFDLVRYDKKGILLQFGTLDDWNAMWDMVVNANFDDSESYENFAAMVDIDNLLSYQAMIQCTQYRSWGWGAYAYKEKKAGSKWRWTLWDMDRCYTELNWNGFTDYANTAAEKWGNLMMQKLLLNPTFKSAFITRVCDFLNGPFSIENTIQRIDSLAAIIAPEIENEAARWSSSLEKWTNNVQYLRDYTTDRNPLVREQMQNYFNLSSPKTLTLQFNNTAGHLQVNSLKQLMDGWQGIYFPDIPLEITAVPNSGYTFTGWSIDSLPQTSTITVNLTENMVLEPLFKQVPSENYFEIISPSVTKTSERLPLVVRSRKPDQKINTLTMGTFHISGNNAFSDSTFKIKKGTSTLYPVINTEQSFSVEIPDPDYQSEKKLITVDNARTEQIHSGELSGQISWQNDVDHIIDAQLTVPAGSSLEIEAGTRVLLKEHVNIFINGSLRINGTKENPVLFTSYDTSYAWGGIEFSNSNSSAGYTFFVNGGGDPAKGWKHTNTQPLLFAKSASFLELQNCYILYSPGKAVGGISSIIHMDQCVTAHIWHGGEFSSSLIHINNSYIMNIPNDDGQQISSDDDNDGFHMDGNYAGEGTSIIENSFFIDGKDDGIDQNHKNLVVRNCWIEGWLHEGIATSGSDTIKVTNTVSSRCFTGFECGFGNPQLILDHCVAFNNNIGFGFGDSYYTPNTGHLTITNSISFDNNYNLRNFTKALQGPYPGGIEVTYTMTNDTAYDDLTGNIVGIPEFDEYYYLLASSPGASAGINGTNMGLVEEIPALSSPVIINEIMYRASASFDGGDWVELYNPANQAKNISGWILKDENDEAPFIIPQGTIINSRDYLVLTKDAITFKSIYPSVNNIAGNFEFGLNSISDKVRLLAPNGFIVDSVAYSSSGSWPQAPNGMGPSLQLNYPLSDNNTAQSWSASNIPGGTPGRLNENLTGVENPTQLAHEFKLYQNYPNPFNPQTTINYRLPESAKVKLALYDITGRLVKILVNGYKNAGDHQQLFTAENMASGIYIYQLKAGNYSARRKMLYIK